MGLQMPSSSLSLSSNSSISAVWLPSSHEMVSSTGRDLRLVVGVNLPADVVVVHGVLHVVRVVLEAVLRLDLLLVLLVLSLVLLRLLDHALDVLLRQAALVVGEGDLVLLAGGLVLGGDVEDAVGVDVEAHVDLGHAARRGGDALQLELAEQVVVL